MVDRMGEPGSKHWYTVLYHGNAGNVIYRLLCILPEEQQVWCIHELMYPARLIKFYRGCRCDQILLTDDADVLTIDGFALSRWVFPGTL